MPGIALEDDESYKKAHDRQQALIEMRSAGLPKPPDVTWADWTGVRKVHPRIEVMVLMHVMGHTNTEIAKKLGYSQAAVSSRLNNSVIKKHIEKVKVEHRDASIKSRLNTLMPKAFENLEDALNQQNSMAGLKSKEVLDASLKLIQMQNTPEEGKSSSVGSFIDILKQVQSAGMSISDMAQNIVKAKETGTMPPSHQTIDIDPNLIPDVDDYTPSAASDWVTNNIPEFDTKSIMDGKEEALD